MPLASVLSAFTLAIVAACGNTTAPDRLDHACSAIADAFTVIGRDERVEVAVERALFERPAAKNFFVHVRVTNLSAQTLGIDLRDRSDLLHPNQWTTSNEDHRRLISEIRLVPVPFDDARREELVRDFARTDLARIAPGSSLDYYVDFDASGRREVDEQVQAERARFILVSMDGWIELTNGTAAWRLESRLGRDVAIPAPAVWQRVPEGGVVITEHP